MASIRKVYERVKAFNAGDTAVKAVEETTDTIANLNVEQMNKGLNADGKPIGEYASPVYAEVKNRINPLPGFGVPDLHVTGAFYQGVYAKVSGDKVIEGSTDDKATDLEKKYGKQIFGLDDQFRREYVNGTLRPVFMKKVFEATGLKSKK